MNIEEGQPATVNIKNKDYEGMVSRIERMTKDSGTGTGIGVEITLLTPDDDIILGLEAKSKRFTASLTQLHSTTAKLLTTVISAQALPQQPTVTATDSNSALHMQM